MQDRSNDTAAQLYQETLLKLQESEKANAALRLTTNALLKDVKALETAKNKAEAERDALREKLPVVKVPEAVFLNDPIEYEGRKYQILLARIYIKGIGFRTALEIATEEDLKSLATLIRMKSGAVREITAA
jgi:hypothetical protein